jgi:hypothetical protein
LISFKRPSSFFPGTVGTTLVQQFGLFQQRGDPLRSRCEVVEQSRSFGGSKGVERVHGVSDHRHHLAPLLFVERLTGRNGHIGQPKHDAQQVGSVLWFDAFRQCLQFTVVVTDKGGVERGALLGVQRFGMNAHFRLAAQDPLASPLSELRFLVAIEPG